MPSLTPVFRFYVFDPFFQLAYYLWLVFRNTLSLVLFVSSSSVRDWIYTASRDGRDHVSAGRPEPIRRPTPLSHVPLCRDYALKVSLARQNGYQSQHSKNRIVSPAGSHLVTVTFPLAHKQTLACKFIYASQIWHCRKIVPMKTHHQIPTVT